MNSINPGNIVARASSIFSADLDDEIVLMSIEHGAYYGMESTARRIWDLVGKPCSVSDLINILSEEYHVTPEECGKDVIGFLTEMQSEGLIVVT